MESIQNLNSLRLGKLLIHNNGKITSIRKKKEFHFLQSLWPPLSILKSALSLLSLGLWPSLHHLGIGPVSVRAWLMAIHSMIYNIFHLFDIFSLLFLALSVIFDHILSEEGKRRNALIGLQRSTNYLRKSEAKSVNFTIHISKSPTN